MATWGTLKDNKNQSFVATNGKSGTLNYSATPNVADVSFNISLTNADLSLTSVPTNPNLKNIIFNGTQSGLNFSLTNMSNLNFKNTVSNSRFSGSKISLGVFGANVNNCDFSGCTISDTSFNSFCLDTSFNNCNFKNVRFALDLSGCIFSGCVLENCKFQNIQPSTSRPSSVNFQNVSTLLGTEFNGTINNVNFSNATFRNTTFKSLINSSNMTKTSFYSTTFNSTSRIINTSFDGSSNKFTFFEDCSFQSTDVSNSSLIYANINRTKFLNPFNLSNWSQSVFNNCSFENGALNTVNMSNTKFNSTSFTNSQILNSTLSSTGLTSCTFSTTTIDANTLNGSNQIQSSGLSGSIYFGVANKWGIVNGYLLGPNVNLTSCSLASANFSGLTIDLTGSRMTSLKSGYITGSLILPLNYVLRAGYILGPDVNLTNAVITNADLTGADLTSTFIDGIQYFPIMTKIRSRNLTGTPLLNVGWKLVGGMLLGPGADLTRVSLINLDLGGVNFSGAILFELSSSGNTFNPDTTILPLNYKFINGVIVGPSTNLSNSNFSNSDASTFSIKDAHLFGANLTNARWRNVSGIWLTQPSGSYSDWSIVGGYLLGFSANCTEFDFRNLNLSGVKLSSANLTNIIGGPFVGTPSIIPSTWKIINQYLLGPSVVLINANISNQDLSGVDLSVAQINGANISGTDFRFANISNLQSNNLTGTPILNSRYRFYNQKIVGKNLTSRVISIINQSLQGLDLTDSDLSGSILNTVDLSGTILRRSNLSNCQLTNLTLNTNTDLIDAKFVNCIFRGVNFTSMNLRGVNFENSDLSGADFSYSDLSGTNFKGCNLTNTKFTSANMRTILNQTEIYDAIDTDGAYLAKSDLRQYRSIISNFLTVNDFKIIDIPYFKSLFLKNQLSQFKVVKSMPILLIKKTHYKLYEKLYYFYTYVSKGFTGRDYFDTLNLEDVEIRYQIFQRSTRLIQDISFSDDFLLNLILLYNVRDMPMHIMRNINFDNCMYISCCQYFLKNLFSNEHQSFIFYHPAIFDYTMEWFKQKSRLFYKTSPNPTLVQTSTYKFDPDYEVLLQNYKSQMAVVEFYLNCKYTFNKFTSVGDLKDTINKINILASKYGITLMVEKLFKEVIDVIFSPESDRKNEDLYALNITDIIGNYSIERRIVQNFIEKNQIIVNNVFQNNPKLAQFWVEFQNEDVNLGNLKEIVPSIPNITSGINYFRKTLFTNCGNVSYGYIKNNTLLDVLDELRKGNVEPLLNTNDNNIDGIMEYLNDDPIIRKMIENAEQLLQDIYQSDYASIQDLTKMYYFSRYSKNSYIKDKILKYDIHKKINKSSDELRYIRLFSGLNHEILGDEELITTLEEYQRVWNSILSS